MKRLVIGLLALLATAAPAWAVSLTACPDDEATAGARNLVEPWEKNTRTFSSGAIRVALIDTGGEPVCCSMHLLVLSPSASEEGEGYRECTIVNDHDRMGFVGIDFAKLAASYDPAKGLLLSFPYELYVDGMSSKKGVAKVRINGKTGTVTVEK